MSKLFARVVLGDHPMPSVLIVTPGLGRYHRGSFSQLADGMRRGLEALGVPVRVWDAPHKPQFASDTLPVLTGITRVIYCGPPLFAVWTRTLFAILETEQIPVAFVLYANSTTLPPNVVGFLRDHKIDRILTGSNWSRRVIESVPGTSHLPCVVVPPGVEVPDAALAPIVDEDTWAHAVAGTSGRKGTEELLDAVSLPRRRPMPLVIYADATATPWLRGELAARDNPAHVTLRRAYDDSDMPAWWAHRFVVQPSRAEGFGLGPVEATLLGRTVVMRTGTGEPMLPHAYRITPPPADACDWETWDGGDGVRAHPLGEGIRELVVTPATVIRDMMDFAMSDVDAPAMHPPPNREAWSHRAAAYRLLEAIALPVSCFRNSPHRSCCYPHRKPHGPMTTPTDSSAPPPKLSDVPPLSDADAASIKPVPAVERWLPFVGHVGMVAFTSPQPLPPYPNEPGMGLTAMPVQVLSIEGGLAHLRFVRPLDMQGEGAVFTLHIRTDLIASMMTFEVAEKPRIVVPGQTRLAR